MQNHKIIVNPCDHQSHPVIPINMIKPLICNFLSQLLQKASTGEIEDSSYQVNLYLDNRCAEHVSPRFRVSEVSLVAIVSLRGDSTTPIGKGKYIAERSASDKLCPRIRYLECVQGDPLCCFLGFVVNNT